MNCPCCRRETQPHLFCSFCEVYMGNPSTGAKAGVARRFAAQLLDAFSMFVLFWLTFMLAGVLLVATNSIGLWFLVFFGAAVAHVIFSLGFLARGKTIGKWMVGVRVIDKINGSEPGIGRMLVRETLGKIVSGVFFSLGYFWAIFDPDGQAWHDKIAGTVVVRNSVFAAAPAPQAPPPLLCQACGAGLQYGSQFCVGCGGRV